MRVAALLVALLACAPAAVFASNAEGEKFLSENKEKEGVVTTKSSKRVSPRRSSRRLLNPGQQPLLPCRPLSQR